MGFFPVVDACRLVRIMLQSALVRFLRCTIFQRERVSRFSHARWQIDVAVSRLWRFRKACHASAFTVWL
jgi:hypothetical protein